LHPFSDRHHESKAYANIRKKLEMSLAYHWLPYANVNVGMGAVFFNRRKIIKKRIIKAQVLLGTPLFPCEPFYT